MKRVKLITIGVVATGIFGGIYYLVTAKDVLGRYYNEKNDVHFLADAIRMYVGVTNGDFPGTWNDLAKMGLAKITVNEVEFLQEGGKRWILKNKDDYRVAFGYKVDEGSVPVEPEGGFISPRKNNCIETVFYKNESAKILDCIKAARKIK